MSFDGEWIFEPKLDGFWCLIQVTRWQSDPSMTHRSRFHTKTLRDHAASGERSPCDRPSSIR